MEFIDLKSQYAAYREEIDACLSDVMERAEFIGGQYVDSFELLLASYVGRKHCISCANGTEALMLAFMAYDIQSNDAVFCPDMTFISSVEPAVMLGATPVFCDIDPDSYNIDLADLRNKIEITRKAGKLRPRFVVAVDFLGNPASYCELEALCEECNLILIEDAAQGMGGVYHEKRLGSFGDISTTSFFPSKPLGCYGDGGAVFTDDDNIAALIRSLKVHGKGATKYDNVRIGMNSRLDNIQAAILRVKFAHFEDEVVIRQEKARMYYESLSELLKCPFIEEGCCSAYAQYVVLADDGAQRAAIIEAMSRNSIPSLIYYPKPLHRMRAFGANNFVAYPVADKYAECNVGLPFSPFLDEHEQKRVIDCISNAIK